MIRRFQDPAIKAKSKPQLKFFELGEKKHQQGHPVGALHLDFSFVGRNDASGNGQVETVPARLAVSGLVGAGKPVKEKGILLLIHWLYCHIGHHAQSAVPLFLQPQLQVSSGGRVLQGIVK